ncbi:hypothetical protein H4Q26_017096 [Puccinia striiformis f. sp. tritici PST-130]|nr:hypothetical protein H4Q26_017096 [Puccinia striiformis f. sp. tritici PST-130]
MGVEEGMKTVYLVRQLEVIGLNAKVVEEGENPTTTTDRLRRTKNNSIVRRPGIDYDIELIRDDFNIFAPYRRYTTRSPVPPPRYDEPDPIVLVESLANRATTPPNREIPQLVVPHHMISLNENG